MHGMTNENWMIIVASFMFFTACGPLQDFPLTVNVELGPDSTRQVIAALTSEINARAGCAAVTVADSPAPATLHWASWPEMAAHFGMAANGGGVSMIEDPSVIWIATSGLPPEVSQNGLLSDCETGYLWVFWLGRLAGLQTQYTDPTHITYGHPDCPGGKPAFDLVGDLLAQLEAHGDRICSANSP